MKKSILILALLFVFVVPSSIFAFTECGVTANKVYIQLSGENQVWVCFNEGGCVYKTGTQLTEAQLSSFYAMALTAKTTGKTLRVRYPEDDLVCPATGHRNDIRGMWLE